jgi:hypothetical protein
MRARPDGPPPLPFFTANIEEELRRPRFTTARLAEDVEKKPPAPSVRRRKRPSRQARRYGLR